MNIHEYQAKEILKEYGIPIPKGKVAYTVRDAIEIARKLNTDIKVVKAQIHAGGRGKAGGIKVSKNIEEVKKNAEYLLGKTIITKQTGQEGKIINCVLVEEGIKIKKEFYVAITIDRKISRVIIIGSSEGGTEIEEIARISPEKIFKEIVDSVLGLRQFQVRRLAYSINIPNNLVESFVNLMMRLYKIFIDKDCALIEINPLVVTDDNQIVVLDTKINFDSNALYRHSELIKLRDINEEKPEEIKAAKFNLSYIALEGNIGCMVNGAGLAMATMDIIKYYGGEPANFLDVGGGASVEKVTEAFKILVYSKKVKGIFVNIFGGIMKCDIIATGIVTAAKETKNNLPIVVRLEGTNIDMGKQILHDSGVNVFVVDSMADGAKKIVEIVLRRTDI